MALTPSPAAETSPEVAARPETPPQGLTAAEVAERTAKGQTNASGVRTSAYNLFWALGAWGAGLLIDRVGYSAMFLVSGALTMAASLLFFGLFSLPGRRR